MTIRLQETLRAAFYAPYYVALARGAYAQEGVEVRFLTAPSPGTAAKGCSTAASMCAGAGRCG